MVRTIYRGYDITNETPAVWKVYDPKRPGVFLAEFTSEDMAMNFIDKTRRARVAAAPYGD